MSDQVIDADAGDTTPPHAFAQIVISTTPEEYAVVGVALIPAIAGITTAVFESNVEKFADLVATKVLQKQVAVKKGTATVYDTIANHLGSADLNHSGGGGGNSKPDDDKQKTHDVFSRHAEKVISTGVLHAGALSENPQRHKARAEFVGHTLEQFRKGTVLSSMQQGERAQFGRAAERFARGFKQLLTDPLLGGPLSRVIVQVKAMESAIAIACSAAADTIGDITLFVPSQLEPNARKVLQESIAIVLWKGEPFSLRLYLYAVYRSHFADATESAAITKVSTLLRTRCAASPLAISLDDDYAGDAITHANEEEEPARKKHMPERNPGGSAAGGGSRHNDRPTAAPEPLATISKTPKDELADCKKWRNWMRKDKVKIEPGTPLPRATECNFRWSARHLFPITHRQGSPCPAKWARPEACIICGDTGHFAALCTNWEGIDEGEPWWKLLELAANKEGLTLIVPSEREDFMVTFAKNVTKENRLRP